MHVLVNGEEEHSHTHEHEHPHDHVYEHGHDHPHEHEHGHGYHHHATMAWVEHTIQETGLPPEVKEQALEVYRTIAQAESAAHGCPVDQVHFHEVGALDAVADVTAVCLLLHMLAPETIASPVHLQRSGALCPRHSAGACARHRRYPAGGFPPTPVPSGASCAPPPEQLLLKTFAQSFGPHAGDGHRKGRIGVGTSYFEAANVRVFWGCDARAGAEGKGADRGAALQLTI